MVNKLNHGVILYQGSYTISKEEADKIDNAAKLAKEKRNMKFKIPIEIRQNGSFRDLIFIKSKKYNIALDTGTYFCMSAVDPLYSSGECDIPYLLCGDNLMGKTSTWNINLISEEDITIPNILIGLHIPRIPESEVGYWDFLVGMMFMKEKKLHLDVDCLGGLKEGWLEINYEK